MPEFPAKYFPISNLTPGLNSQDPVVKLIPGELSQAKNVAVQDGRLKSAPGHVRLTTTLPNDASILLDGESNYYHARVNHAASNVTLGTNAGDPWTVEYVFRMDAFPPSTISSTFYAMMVFKGTGVAADDTLAVATEVDWCSYIFVSTIGGLTPRLALTDSGGTLRTFTGATLANPQVGVFYHVAFAYDGTNVRGVVHEVGTAATLAAPTALVLGVQTSTADLFVGGEPKSVFHRDREEMTLRFPGVIQEFRIWNDARSDAELTAYDAIQFTADEATAETNLVYYQPLTVAKAEDRYFFPSVKGTAGSGSGESPILYLMPRAATWRGNGHVLGTPIADPVIDFDGRLSVLEVKNSYLYRETVPDEDGKFLLRDTFCVSFRANARTLVNGMTLFHWVPVTSPTFAVNELADVTTVNGVVPLVNEVGNVLIDLIDIGAGSFRVRLVVWHGVTANAIRVATEPIAAGTEFTVTASVDSESSINLLVNGVTASAAIAGAVPSTDDDPAGSARKYWMAVGRSIYQTRQDELSPGDPNGIDVEYSTGRTFDGEIKQLVIFSPPAGTALALIVDEYLSEHLLTRGSVQSLGSPILSAWVMTDGDGDQIEDIGLQTNPIVFRSDSKHSWGLSGITTNERSRVDGLFDHRYRTATGESKQVVAVAKGAAYTLNTSTGAMTYLTDGIRNEDGHLVRTAKHLDSQVLVAGSRGGRNGHLWKDQLYTLDIEPPTGFIPVGVTEQLNEEAKLREGIYRYGFAYYSAHLNKWSPMVTFVDVNVRSDYATIVMGPNAEINQTYPTTGFCDNKDPYDLSTGAGSTDLWVDTWSWVGTDQNVAFGGGEPDWWEEGVGGGGARENKRKTAKFTFDANGEKTTGSIKNPLISDKNELTKEECRTIVEGACPRCWVETNGDGYWRINSVFLGADAHLIVQTRVSASVDLTTNGGTFDFDTAAKATAIGGGAQTQFDGTGTTGHGLTLPRSSNRQVTHLGVFRTLANSTDLRLVALLPNGTEGFTDTVTDDNNTGQVFDVSSSAAPPCKYVAEFEGRYVYAGDLTQPQRVYFSEIGEPWNVPARNVVDFLDGDSLGITGIARTEGALILFKSDTTFVLTASTSPLLPFEVHVRSRDAGCVAPYGIANVHENLFFPGEKGFFRFDTSFPEYLSRKIEPTWRGYPSTYRDLISVAHDRKNETLLWSVATGNSVDADGNKCCDELVTWRYSNGADAMGDRHGWAQRTGVYVRFFAVLERDDDEDTVFIVDPIGYISTYDSGTNYGVGTLTSRTPATAAGTFSVTKVTIAQATLAALPEGYKGLPITVVDATDGTRATRLCTADTLASPSVLTLDHDLPFTPVQADTVLIGSIEADAILGELSPSGSPIVSLWVDTFLRQEAQGTAAQLEFGFVGSGGVRGPRPETFVAIANSKEWTKFATACRGTELRGRVRALGPDKPFSVVDLIYKVKAEGEGENPNLTS